MHGLIQHSDTFPIPKSQAVGSLSGLQTNGQKSHNPLALVNSPQDTKHKRGALHCCYIQRTLSKKQCGLPNMRTGWQPVTARSAHYDPNPPTWSLLARSSQYNQYYTCTAWHKQLHLYHSRQKKEYYNNHSCTMERTFLAHSAHMRKHAHITRLFKRHMTFLNREHVPGTYHKKWKVELLWDKTTSTAWQQNWLHNPSYYTPHTVSTL